MRILTREPTTFFSRSEVWLVHSELVGGDFRICITAPELPSGAALPASLNCGAVIGLDAGLLAGAVASMCRSGMLAGELPPLYAVSVGYAVDSDPPHLLQRNRDLTPSDRSDLVAFIPKLWGVEAVVTTGGADLFLRFLREELRPALAEAFPIDAADTTLVGASLGGLFTLHALLTDPEAFSRYLAISPSIWWDHRLLLTRAKQLVQERSKAKARLYMCAGERESVAHVKAQFDAMPPEVTALMSAEALEVDMLGDMFAMRDVLSAWACDDFSVEAHVYPEESHTSIGGVALSRGLRRLYGAL